MVCELDKKLNQPNALYKKTKLITFIITVYWTK